MNKVAEFVKKFMNLRGYFFLGFMANVSFIIFIIVTLAYYTAFTYTAKSFLLFDAIAYFFEMIGFIFLSGSTLGLIGIMRDRKPMKIALAVYFFMELILVILDLNIIESDFFDATNKVVIIIHCILSIGTGCTFLSLEYQNKYLERLVLICSVIMAMGIFCVIYDSRVYVSILINCIAYLIMYYAIMKMLDLEYIEIDCHGDTVSVLEVDKSTFDLLDEEDDD